MKQTKNMKI